MFYVNSKQLILVSLVFIFSNLFATSSNSSYLPCLYNPELQHVRSIELKNLVDADQKEREDWDNLSDDEKLKMLERDLIRRKRVGEILGEGCFKTPEDYAAASLIYQHGDAPDHYYQAFIWANRAVDLGDEKQKNLVALTIDRYLVSIGKKQLFGSQAFAEQAQECFCLEQVEESFPDAIRTDYTGLSLVNRYEWLAAINSGKICLNSECSKPLNPTAKGTIPGFW